MGVHRGWLKGEGDHVAHPELIVPDPLANVPTRVPVVFEEGPPGPPRIAWVSGDDHDSPPLAHLLRSFVKLADATNEDIVRAAMRWGPLGICEHLKPAAHAGCEPLAAEHRAWEERREQLTWSLRLGSWPNDTDRVPFTAGRSPHWEPLEAWRFYARGFRALLHLAGSLRDGLSVGAGVWQAAAIEPKLPNRVELAIPDWGALATPGPWQPTPDALEKAAALVALPRDLARANFASLVDAHLAESGVLPRLSWDAGGPKVSLALGAPRLPCLSAVLICQLAAITVGRKPGARRCSWCREPYALLPDQRKPRRDKREFCSEACRKEDKAARDHAYNTSEKGLQTARERRKKRE